MAVRVVVRRPCSRAGLPFKGCEGRTPGRPGADCAGGRGRGTGIRSGNSTAVQTMPQRAFRPHSTPGRRTVLWTGRHEGGRNHRAKETEPKPCPRSPQGTTAERAQRSPARDIAARALELRPRGGRPPSAARGAALALAPRPRPRPPGGGGEAAAGRAAPSSSAISSTSVTALVSWRQMQMDADCAILSVVCWVKNQQRRVSIACRLCAQCCACPCVPHCVASGQ